MDSRGQQCRGSQHDHEQEAGVTFETEIIDRLFLELSQFTTASTQKELAYRKAMRGVLTATTLAEAKDDVRPLIEAHVGETE